MILSTHLHIIIIMVLCFLCIKSLSVRDSQESPVSSFAKLKHRAKETYTKVIPCLQASWTVEEKRKSRFKFPSDALKHFDEIKSVMSKYNNIEVHAHPSGFKGPWIENQFVQRYSNRSLHTFNGLIPLFIHWQDNLVHNNYTSPYYTNIANDLRKLLRPTVIYVTISYSDFGLASIGNEFKNILVISCGGYGHIPGLELQNELPLMPTPDTFLYDISFYGTTQWGDRKSILPLIATAAKQYNVSYSFGQGSDWQHVMSMSKFVLAPRGIGRSSFRCAETILMGRIPIWIYTDIPWIPYMHTDIDITTYSYTAYYNSTTGKHNLTELIQQISLLTTHEYMLKLNRVQRLIRPYFTYNGFFSEFDKFLMEPFGIRGGYLRCGPHPTTDGIMVN